MDRLAKILEELVSKYALDETWKDKAEYIHRAMVQRQADSHLEELLSWFELLAPNGLFQTSEISGTTQVHEKVRKECHCDARFVLQSVHESANPGFSGRKCNRLLQDRILPW
jgi:hypothetical protein